MALSKATPLALALCYIEQDPLGFKVLMEDVMGAEMLDLLQESLMWNARFLQKAGQDSDEEAQVIARQIINQIKLRELDEF